MKEALEGLLFLTGDEGLTLLQIKEILEITEEESIKLIEQLINDYNSNRGLTIKKLGSTYKMTTKNEYARYYQKLGELANIKNLSQSALETLAIIAYNEPITRSQVDELRGINSSQMIRNLLSRDFIKEVGRSNSVGKPVLYGVTDQFLDYFGLEDISKLPKIEETSKEELAEVDLYKSKYQEEIIEQL